MPVIEGIGDEILQFLFCLFMASLVIAAWFSTKVRDVTSCRMCLNCLIILIHWMQRRGLEETSESSASNDENVNEEQPSSVEQSQTTETDSDIVRRENSNPSTAVISTTSEPNLDGILIRQEATNDRTRLELVESQTKEKTSTAGSSVNDSLRVIKIKLKYLNDSIRIAEGDLLESLSEFKRRHFSSELSRGDTITLVFNGKILDSDRQTLVGYGLFDNCVVHCLVRQGRPGASLANTQPLRRRRRRRTRQDDNFSVRIVLFPTLGMILVGIWYSRYRYSESFSMTATVGLLVLSGLYIAALVGTCLPEEEVGLVPVI